MSYLPPGGREALIRETVMLLGGITAFILVLAAVVALTQGVVFKIA